MPSPDQVAAVAREWMLRAEEDLRAAAHLLKLRDPCPTATVGFHAQQCVEKYLKALLVMKGIQFPKTHDLEQLVGLLPLDVSVPLPVPMQRTLTTYGTMTRYPGEYEPVTVTESRQALTAARRVRRALRDALPKPDKRRG